MPVCSLLMQSESSRYEETPSLLWGLDPVFVAFAKLYIRDILTMKESRQVPGIFFYNGHPVKQVDILGTVIGVKEKDAFYGYGDKRHWTWGKNWAEALCGEKPWPNNTGPFVSRWQGLIVTEVDDSTGVINCICWKKSRNTESSPAAPSSAGELSMISKLEKLQETIEQRTRIEIGDIIRIRGFIRTYREEREIHATTYYKVDDPMWNIQIARMLELPDLYRRIYDQPFHSPALEQEEANSLWSSGPKAEVAWWLSMAEERCSPQGDQEAEREGATGCRQGPSPSSRDPLPNLRLLARVLDLNHNRIKGGAQEKCWKK
ncbi:CST complex subunit STN1 isoform X6 [Cavia porcellus]|uniref:CST complex subunit STN1 isoform X6 n=1 Tax=Cavia porcellus TaxID=10141 RepID=UPI002FE0B83D